MCFKNFKILYFNFNIKILILVSLKNIDQKLNFNGFKFMKPHSVTTL